MKSASALEHDNKLLLKWTTLSQSLSIGLICVVVLTVLLFSICYWSLGRLFQEEEDKVSFHFTRMMDVIREHEVFLGRIARKSDKTTQKYDYDVVPLQRHLLAKENGLAVYEGREFSFAMPFLLATKHALSADSSGDPFSLGVLLANFYGSFWSVSAYPAPQLLIFDLSGSTRLAVPSIPSTAQRDRLSGSYPMIVERILARLRTRPVGEDAQRVHWIRADRYRDSALEMLGVARVDLPETLWWHDEPNHLIIAASLLDLRRINDFEQLVERPAFDSYSLVSPDGEVLLGAAPATGLRDGLNLTRQGVAVQLRSQPENGWLAVYRTDYGNFFRHSRWLVAGLLLTPALLLAGWLGMRWYTSSVVNPVHRAHRQLVESDTFSRTLIQTAPVALVVLTQDDQQLVTCNHLAAQWLGGPTEILGLTSNWKLFDARGQVPGDICIQVGGRYLQTAFAATRYAGTEAVLCVFNDITVHCEAETALSNAKRAADAASQAKTLFLARMSHEIRTPLYGVLGTLELLDLTTLNERQRAYLRTIQSSSATLMQLISDVLDVSKIEAGQMALTLAAFNPLDLVREVLGNFAASAMAKDLQFYACIDTEVPAQLIGDVTRIRQVLNNLVNNALKFTDIGRVVLRVKLLSRNDGRALLQWQVADTGIGIAHEQQERLFEAFYQVSGAHHAGGTGLGLSICWHLAEMMGGHLRMVSETGLGSSFSLVLELPEDEQSGLACRPGLLKSACVHVRSPVRELADSVGAWLKAWGCKVSSGEAAPSELETCVLLELQLFDSGRFDLLLSDVNMPNMTGYELTQALRERGETLPIIGVTANALREEGERCRAVGMNSWLVKPITLHTLHELLSEFARAGVVLPAQARDLGPPAQLDDGLSPQVPERMRALFLETMGKDLEAARQAIRRNDPKGLQQDLHRMAGSLAVMRARTLVVMCQGAEEGLLESRLECSAVEIGEVLVHIEQALEFVRKTG